MIIVLWTNLWTDWEWRWWGHSGLKALCCSRNIIESHDVHAFILDPRQPQEFSSQRFLYSRYIISIFLLEDGSLSHSNPTVSLTEIELMIFDRGLPEAPRVLLKVGVGRHSSYIFFVLHTVSRACCGMSSGLAFFSSIFTRPNQSHLTKGERSSRASVKYIGFVSPQSIMTQTVLQTEPCWQE